MKMMKKSTLFLAAIATLLLSTPSTSFTTPSPKSSPKSKSLTSLQLHNKSTTNNILASACILSTLLLPTFNDAAFALDNNDVSTLNAFNQAQNVIAARSGGRAGGRASMARPAMRSSPSRMPSSSSRTVINRTTVIAPPTPVFSAPIVVSPFGYSPFSPGIGFGTGLGTINAIGNEIRDYRQESEIQRERTELEVEKERSRELEMRINQLENAQRMQQQAPVVQQQQSAPAELVPQQ